jgi:phage tail tape-measure protein
VVKGRSAKLGAAVGRYAGAKTGEAALSAVPIVGNWLGGKAGDKAGREIALRLVGGQETMRETSDLSFDRMEDMIVYLYARHYDPKNKEWRETFDLTKEIYPDIEKKWVKALKKAPRRRS